jgi:Bax protein
MYPSWLGLVISPGGEPVPVMARASGGFVVTAAPSLPKFEPPSSIAVARAVSTYLERAASTPGQALTGALAEAALASPAFGPALALATIFEFDPDGGPHVQLRSAEALDLYFDALDFDLESVRKGDGAVPRRYLASLPPDLDDLASPGDRKQLFIKALLPLVLKVNEEIESDRGRLERVRKRLARSRALNPVDTVWLDEQFVRYDVGDDDLAELARRMDVIPPSLALAQAAEESGWGTSRFAREGNALFGQYTTADGPGLDPLSEDAGKYRIRSYDNLVETVRSYALNLNLHPAYREFRDLRAELRAKREPIDGYQLAGTLKRYSERSKAYVKTIRVIIQENELRQLDGLRLPEPVLSREDRPAGAPAS